MSRVALIHYWMTGMRGGEKVLKTIAALFPGADIYTHVADPALLRAHFPGHQVRETFIGRLPFARQVYQYYLPLMPMALEQVDLGGYDLVISSESGPAKGVIVPPHVPHLCYCHSPMRYLWDMYPEYLRSKNAIVRAAMRPLFHYLRIWDQLCAARVDHFVANSDFVASRIAKYYRRPASVVHPGIEISRYQVSLAPSGNYLFVGELVGYKRAELAVRAFNQLRRPLDIVGDGPERRRLQAIAGPNVRFLGRIADPLLRELLSGCKALVFPGVEDFGLVPVEAMASGRPVIALRAGGALETVVDGMTGVFFDQPDSVGHLIAAVERFESLISNFDSHRIREHAERFSNDRFAEAFKKEVRSLLDWKFSGED